MIVSCHIPKTAGVSFATALHEAFGERFFWDRSHKTIIADMYDENRLPIESVPIRWLSRYSPPSLRGIECIHGHFPLQKYLSLAFHRDNIFAVWLRDPLRWRISLYYFWKQLYPHPIEKYLNRMFDEHWDIERFCLDPTFDNYQSRYLAWFPWHRINFVGVTDNYASDLDYLARHVLRRDLSVYNLNPSKKPEESPAGCLGSRFFRRFESNNRIDYRNYRAARRVSDARALRQVGRQLRVEAS